MYALIRHEGMVPHLGEHYEVMAKLHLAVGDRRGAKKYADMAREEVKVFGPSWGDDGLEDLEGL